MKTIRKIIEINELMCNGCGECIIACAEGALKIVDGKARLVSDIYCDGLGACIGNCPQGALKIIEKLSEEFDEKAVEEHIREIKQGSNKVGITGHFQGDKQTLACGCPSTNIQTFTPCPVANKPADFKSNISALSNWPIQINLIPHNASFLSNADLLIAADCTAFTNPNFHSKLLTGKILMIGCPKMDNIDAYFEKFCDIFKHNNIKSITVCIMEVPCCAKLPLIVKKALEISGKKIPTETLILKIKN